MRFSRQVHYAIYGVFDLAYNGDGKAVQVRVISERQSIPTRYLEQIFQRLRRGLIVSAKRGPGGGYQLTRDPAEITLGQIIEAVEGPTDGGQCVLADRPCDETGACALHVPWKAARSELLQQLDSVSVSHAGTVEHTGRP